MRHAKAGDGGMLTWYGAGEARGHAEEAGRDAWMS